MNIETELIKQISQGDKIAFKELYALFSNKVYATALHYLQNIPDAEEVTQNVFLSIFNNASSFKGNSSVSTWIYRISVNASLNFLKSQKRRTLLFFDDYKKEMPDFDHPGIIEENKEKIKNSKQPIIISGGGVLYSEAEKELAKVLSNNENN